MSANRALVNSLELFMDELFDSFQDYVKESLILLSLGLGTVLFMLGYFVKMLNRRPEDVQAVRQSRSRRNRTSSDQSLIDLSRLTKSANNIKGRSSSHSKRSRRSYSNISVQSYPVSFQIDKNEVKSISSPVSPCPSYSQNKQSVNSQTESNIVTTSNKSVNVPSSSSCCSTCVHCLPQIHVYPSSENRPRKSSPGPKKTNLLTKSRHSLVKLKPAISCCSICCNQDKDKL